VDRGHKFAKRERHLLVNRDDVLGIPPVVPSIETSIREMRWNVMYLQHEAISGVLLKQAESA